jgi:hypothetical protein
VSAPVEPTALVRYDAMCRAIADAYEVDEVKDLRDKALAIEVYARQAKNVEAERQACEIRLRAERRWGQLYKAGDKATSPGWNQHRGRSDDATDHPPTLTDMGVSRDQSSNWQKLADVPEPEFEHALATDAKPTIAGIIAAHAEPKQQHPVDLVDEQALWLWGRLKDFQRDGILDLDPSTICETMLPHMRETVRELIPTVIDWLRKVEP